jgi:hypothetical protein
MTAFKNTILGKVLGTVAKVALPVIGAITGIGAIAGIAKGVGVLSGIGGTVSTIAGGVKSVIDKVGVGAVNLVTGTTQPERQQVAEVKATSKALSDKWAQVDRLIKAGDTPEQAQATVGVSPDSTVVVGNTGVTPAATAPLPANTKYLVYAGIGLAALLILPKIIKR